MRTICAELHRVLVRPIPAICRVLSRFGQDPKEQTLIYGHGRSETEPKRLQRVRAIVLFCRLLEARDLKSTRSHPKTWPDSASLDDQGCGFCRNRLRPTPR